VITAVSESVNPSFELYQITGNELSCIGKLFF